MSVWNAARTRLGSARLGSARLGSARLGSARLGSANQLCDRDWPLMSSSFRDFFFPNPVSRNRHQHSGSNFSPAVMGLALPFRMSRSETPSKVANLWSY